MQPSDHGIAQHQVEFELRSDGGQEAQLPAGIGSPIQPHGLVRQETRR